MCRLRHADAYYNMDFTLQRGKLRGVCRISGWGQRGVAVAQWGFYDPMMQGDGVESPVTQFTTPGPGERIVAFPPQPAQPSR
jgi:hypothetical protein